MKKGRGSGKEKIGVRLGVNSIISLTHQLNLEKLIEESEC